MNIATIVAVLLFSYFVTRRVNRIELEYAEKSRTLMDQWTHAFRERVAWFQAHRDILPNARSHSDYIELWEREIGAEALLLIHHGRGAEMSLEEYKAEQASVS